MLSLTAPVAVGYMPLGAVFGFLFVQAGAPWWMAMASSLLVFAGAAQYMMIPMVAAGLPVGAIALATLVLNLRHLFYGLSLLDRFPRHPFLRWYSVFALTDETYSVLVALPDDTPPERRTLLALLNHGWWVLGTVIGALVGARQSIALSGLDFVLTALFAVLAVEQWRARKSSLPLWTALAAYALAYALWPRHALVLAIVSCVAAALLLPEAAEQSLAEEGGQ